jgi:hypothetical protein
MSSRPASLIAATIALLMVEASAQADDLGSATSPPTCGAAGTPCKLDQPASSANFLASDCIYPDAALDTTRIGNHVLSIGRGRWALFDADSRAALTEGNYGNDFFDNYRFRPELSGSQVLSQTRTSKSFALQLIDSADVHSGILLPDTTPETNAGFARDGSYVWIYDGRSAISLMSLTGKPLVAFSYQTPFRSFPTYYAPSEVRVLENPDYVVDLASGATRNLPARPERLSADWFEDGAHYIEYGKDGRTRVLTAAGALVQEFSLRTTPAKPDETSTHVRLAGFGRYFFRFAPQQTVIYRLEAPLGARDEPVPVHVVRHLEPDTRRFSQLFRGSLAVTYDNRASFHLVDLRGETPVETMVTLPGAPYGSFSSDDQGRWSVAVNDRIYASDAPASTSYHLLGCRAP